MNHDDPSTDQDFESEPPSETEPLDMSEAPVQEEEAEVDPAAPVSSEPSAPISARTELPFGLVLFLIIAVLLVIFTVQNSSEDVTLRFLVWEGEYPLALIIIGVVTVSVILDEVMGLFLRQRRRRRLAEKRELKRLRELNR